MFILVKSKKRNNKSANNKIINNKTTTNNNNEEDLVVIVDKEYVFNLNKKILEYKQKLRDYDTQFYWPKMQISLHKILFEYFHATQQQETDHIKNRINLICYGLGSVDDNICSRYQLALFQLIIDEINSINHQQINKLNIEQIEFYDPIFNKNDKFLLESILNYKISSQNEQCFKQIELVNDSKVLNIFYMPHCEKSMYNNLLFSNWQPERLNSLLILGNSFQTITTNTVDNKMNKHYTFVQDSLDLIKEIKINSDCDLTSAFTDLSFHLFDTSRVNDEQLVNKLTINKPLQKPLYENSELF